jgi:hypothetical protein
MSIHRASPARLIAALSLAAAGILGCADSVAVSEDAHVSTGVPVGSTSSSSSAGGAGAGGSGAGAGGGGANDACAPAWTHVVGGPGTQIGRSVAIDATGGRVVSVQGGAGATLDGAPLVKPGAGFLLARLEASGAAAWARTFGGTDLQDQLLPLAIDADGSVVVAGTYDGAFDLGAGLTATTPLSALFVARVSATGEPLWLRSFPTGGYGAAVAGLALDAAGDVFLVGGIGSGSLDLGGETLTGEMFVAKLDPSGAPLWQHAYAGGGPESHTLAVSAAGGLVFGGSLSTEADFGGGPLTSAGGYDLFVASLDADGHHLWSERFGDAGLQRLHALALTPSGNVILGGTYFGTLDLGGGPLSAGGSYGSFVAALDPSGHHLWSRTVGGDVFGVTSLAVLPSGNILASGLVGSAPSLGCGAIGDTSVNGTYLATLDASGACLSLQPFGAGSTQYIEDLKASPTGHAVAMGYFQGTIDLGAGPVPADGNDTFVLAIPPPCAP